MRCPWDAAMSHLREGDTLVVWKMDRLGRTVLQSVQFLNSLHKEKIEFRSLTEGIDTNTPMGKFYFHMAAALAELERDRLIERTNAGLAAAKARGRKGGRKRALSVEQEALALDMMKDGSRSMAQVAKLMNVSRSTISRLVERAGGRILPRHGARLSLKPTVTMAPKPSQVHAPAVFQVRRKDCPGSFVGAADAED